MNRVIEVANDFKEYEDNDDNFMTFIVGLELNKASSDYIEAGGTLDELYETVHAILPDIQKGSAFGEDK
ncbi:hypothetical protein GH854_34070, partial [Bacillus thuringiensis]|nr:hypothetical protein [Bacillus thuringiensis]